MDPQLTPDPPDLSDTADLRLDDASQAFLRYRDTGDHGQLERALVACAPALRRAALSTSAAGDADDVVQQAFLVAIRNHRSYRGRAPLLKWLLGILSNIVRSRRRSQARRGQADIVFVDAVDVDRVGQPGEKLQWEQWREVVRAQIESLAEPYRTVLMRHVLDGASASEIAEHLGRSPSTVRTQLQRGLESLRRRLPAPILAGLCALLAVRSTRASPRSWVGPKARRVVATGAVAIVVGLLCTWRSDGDTPPRSVSAVAAVEGSVVATSAPRAPELPAARTPVASGRPTVRVRLRHADGSPAAGMVVALDPEFEPGRPLVRTRPHWRLVAADQDGVAVFDGVEPGRIALRLDDQQVLHTLELGRDSRAFDFTVRAAARLRIRCVDETDLPVAGATIHVSWREGNGTAPGLAVARTDADGAAVVYAHQAKTYCWATAAGHQACAVHGPLRSPGQLEEHDVTLRVLRGGQRLGGTVVGLDRAPVAGATVAVWKRASKFPVLFATTDARGRFECEGLPPGPWQVAAGTLEFASPAVEVAADQPQVRLDLVAGAEIEGRIGLAPAMQPQRLRVLTMRLGDNTLPLHPFDASACSVGADGRYRLAGVLPGAHMVGLFEPGGQTPVAAERVCVGDRDLRRVDFSRDVVEPWQVLVVDAKGVPRVGWTVRADSGLPLLWGRHRQEGQTDADGIVRFSKRDTMPQLVSVSPVGDGLYGVLPTAVFGPVMPERRTVVTVPDAGPPGVVRGVVPPGVRELATRHGLEFERDGAVLRVRVDADGAFAAEGLPAGAYRVCLAGGDGARAWTSCLAHVEVRAGETRDLGCLADPGVGGAVLELRAEAAVRPVFCVLREAGGALVEQGWLEPGETRRSALVAGHYVLRFASSRAVAVERRFEVRPGTETMVELERRAGRACRIEVQAGTAWPAPTPLRGTVQAEAGGEPCEFILRIEAGRDSWATALDLQPGRYRFTAQAPWGPTAEGILVVTADEGELVFPFALR